MISLRMLNPLTGDTPTFGPAPVAIITGEKLTLGREDVAVHKNGQWHHKDRHYTTILLESPATVTFEDDAGNRSRTHGPFETVKIIDGAIRSGEEYRDILARLDESSKHWTIYGAPEEWLRAIFRPA